MFRSCFRLVAALSVTAVCGCALLPSCRHRPGGADAVAIAAGLSKRYVRAGEFDLLTYRRMNKPGESVRIYIEGDGNAWETRSRLSRDPTPRSPVALYLAAEDPYDNVVYLARPGQFPRDGSSDCSPAYWSSRRYSPEVVSAFMEAIDVVKSQAGAPALELVGHSGGAALAVLVAAERDDVFSIMTVAGNLDTDAFCRHHRVSPLTGSLNPLDAASRVAHIPQRHFIGSKDTVVPGFIAKSFVEKEGDAGNGSITTVDGATHTNGWRRRWKELLLVALPAGPGVDGEVCCGDGHRNGQ